MLRQETVVAAPDDVDDRIANADNVVPRLLHDPPDFEMGAL
ncbi:protein of unknown function [Hyphomicrobium sp. 1Nfss2.1]